MLDGVQSVLGRHLHPTRLLAGLLLCVAQWISCIEACAGQGTQVQHSLSASSAQDSTLNQVIATDYAIVHTSDGAV
jgi:hypothetical protein